MGGWGAACAQLLGVIQESPEPAFLSLHTHLACFSPTTASGPQPLPGVMCLYLIGLSDKRGAERTPGSALGTTASPSASLSPNLVPAAPPTPTPPSPLPRPLCGRSPWKLTLAPELHPLLVEAGGARDVLCLSAAFQFLGCLPCPQPQLGKGTVLLHDSSMDPGAQRWSRMGCVDAWPQAACVHRHDHTPTWCWGEIG